MNVCLMSDSSPTQSRHPNCGVSHVDSHVTIFARVQKVWLHGLCPPHLAMSHHIITQLRELAVGRKTEPSVMIVARSASVDLRTLPSTAL